MRRALVCVCVWSVVVVGCGKGGAKKSPPESSKPSDARVMAKKPTDAAKKLTDVAPKTASTPPVCNKRTSKKGDCCVGYGPHPELDASPMCRVKGGTFMMGSDHGRAQPRHKVKLSNFYIDQYEVTAAQYARFLNAVGSHTGCSAKGHRCIALQSECPGARADPGRLPMDKKDGKYVVDPGQENHPARAVSQQGAQRYCAWAGKTLPTEAEWEYAARHDPKTGRDLVYPWGDKLDRNRANCSDSAGCKDEFKTTAPIGVFDGSGRYRDGSSPWGVHDMAGNVNEWVSDCYVNNYDFCKDGCTNPTGTKTCDTTLALMPMLVDGCPQASAVARANLHPTRGGGFGAKAYKTYERNHAPADSLSGAGFRCARR